MSVLPHQAPLEEAWQQLAAWFHSDGEAAPMVAVADWESARDHILAKLSARDSYIMTSEARSISIKEVRQMMSAVVTTTPFGQRLIVIPNCERLTLPAAQALLKFLEEPTPGNRILLVTKFPKRLLPTIRSRVQTIELAIPARPAAATEPFDPIRALTAKHRRELTDKELAAISHALEQHLLSGTQAGPLYRAMLRLRDYYKIRGEGGNMKLAADVLLASLLELDQSEKHTSKAVR